MIDLKRGEAKFVLGCELSLSPEVSPQEAALNASLRACEQAY